MHRHERNRTQQLLPLATEPRAPYLLSEPKVPLKVLRLSLFVAEVESVVVQTALTNGNHLWQYHRTRTCATPVLAVAADSAARAQRTNLAFLRASLC